MAEFTGGNTMNVGTQQQFDAETAQEEYEAEQAEMEPHKRDGYAERMAEMANIRRKVQRENAP